MFSKKTFLKINNHTNCAIQILVDHVDPFDWNNKEGPLKLNHAILGAKGAMKTRLEINSWATANLYTLILVFDGSTALCFRIDQGIAAGRKASYNDYIPPVVATVVGCVTPQALIGLELAGKIGDLIHKSLAHKERGVFKVEGNAPFNVDKFVEDNAVTIAVKPIEGKKLY